MYMQGIACNKTRPVQAGQGGHVKYKRRGWDFTMNNVIKWFHEDAEFRKAADNAHPLKLNDPDSVAGSLYMSLLDRDCKQRLSQRTQ